MTKKKNSAPSLKVVYLLGAGATQAEVSLKDDTIHILMDNIREGILKKIDKQNISELLEIKNELSKEEMDVEHLITLYESTGINKHDIIAKKLKELFINEIREKISKLGADYIPRLLVALIDMHEIDGLNEKLLGIITLNYEDLLEKAMQRVKHGVDYSIKLNSTHRYLKIKPQVTPVLKLHGSFNWKNEFPITLVDEDKIECTEDMLWIPPGVEKKRERYPFNILWGRAKELLDCDILRIIGCSLSRNDWQLISLLYTTQQLTSHKKEYTIELIDYADAGEKIRKDYSYLSFRIISDIKEVRDSLIRSFSRTSKDEEKLYLAIEELLNNRKTNIFDTWLRAKGEDLKERSIQTKTTKNYFENFINEVRYNENTT